MYIPLLCLQMLFINFCVIFVYYSTLCRPNDISVCNSLPENKKLIKLNLLSQKNSSWPTIIGNFSK